MRPHRGLGAPACGSPRSASRAATTRSASSREFAGDDRVVGDYLLAEVLDRQPPRLRAFLLRTSLVDRISGDLADALTDERSGADTLADLERTNGFVIGVDSRREWYRYHRLFAKLLRTRAAARARRASSPALHARAARWYAGAAHGLEALEHAVAARASGTSRSSSSPSTGSTSSCAAQGDAIRGARRRAARRAR